MAEQEDIITLSRELSLTCFFYCSSRSVLRDAHLGTQQAEHYCTYDWTNHPEYCSTLKVQVNVWWHICKYIDFSGIYRIWNAACGTFKHKSEDCLLEEKCQLTFFPLNRLIDGANAIPQQASSKARAFNKSIACNKDFCVQRDNFVWHIIILLYKSRWIMSTSKTISCISRIL